MIKYRLFYKDYDDVERRVDIATASYGGEPIIIKGAGGKAAVLSYNIEDTNDPFSAFVPSKLTVNCLNEGQIDVREIQQAQDKDFVVSLYRKTVLQWQGYITVESMQRQLKSEISEVQIVAVCGLTMLKDIPYANINLQGTGIGYSRCPLNYIRNVLFYNLGISLPIRWTNDLQNTAYLGHDVFTGGVQWATDDQGFSSFQTTDTGESVKPQTCEYILKGFMQSMQCRIFQANGMWVIRRIPNIANAAPVAFKQVPGTLGQLAIQTGNQNLRKQIGRNGNYPFMNEDALVTSIAGIKTCIVTYNANSRQNKLPNGSQDDLLVGVTKYWGFYSPTTGSAIPGLSLTNRGGFSGKISHIGSENPPDSYTLQSPSGGTLGNNGLPIDTQSIVSKINFGFLFEAVDGFPLDSSGFINWNLSPLVIQLIFNDGATKYYLNQFGYWQTTVTNISITIDGLRPGDVASVNFDKFQGIIMPTPQSNPTPGYVSNITVLFNVQGDEVYRIDNIYIQIDDAHDVYSSTLTDSKNTLTDKREINISSSFGGYQISNFMSDWSKSGDECYFRDGAIYEGTLTGLTANAIMRFRYKASEIINTSLNVRGQQWSFDELYLIDSFGSSVFLPMNASYNTETCQVNGLVAMECRNDNITLEEKYYSSNDQQLSN